MNHNILWIFRKNRSHILCFDSIFSQDMLWCSQTDHHRRCVIPSGNFLLQDRRRQLSRRQRQCRAGTVEQTFLTDPIAE